MHIGVGIAHVSPFINCFLNLMLKGSLIMLRGGKSLDASLKIFRVTVFRLHACWHLARGIRRRV